MPTTTINLAGTSTWAAPLDLFGHYVLVECWGPGGAGARGTTNYRGRAGGGGGSYARMQMYVDPGTDYPYTVGAGGTDGASPAKGADTVFEDENAAICRGRAGDCAADNSNTPGAGALFDAADGDVGYNGGDGGEGNTSTYRMSGGGGGGAGSLGHGGVGGVHDDSSPGGLGGDPDGGAGGDGVGTGASVGNVGIQPGGAGSGGYRHTANRDGGAGAIGQIRLTWYDEPTVFSLLIQSILDKPKVSKRYIKIINAEQRTDGSKLLDVNYQLAWEKGRIQLEYNDGIDPITAWHTEAINANVWEAIAFGSHLPRFIAVSSDGTHRVAHSNDGTAWSAVYAAEDNLWMGIAYGDLRFVAVSSDGTNRVMISSTGASWAARAAAEDQEWSAIAFGNGVFVAVADGVDRVMYSSDAGDNWTAVNGCGEANKWSSIAYGNGVFVAVASIGTNRIMRSTNDGATWAAVAAPGTHTWESITYGEGKFVAVASSGSHQIMYSDDDGVSWNAVAATASNAWSSVSYGEGTFVALSADGTDRGMYSYDGISWTAITVELSAWAAVMYGNDRFVAVADSGTSQAMYAYSGVGSVWVTPTGADLSGDVNKSVDPGNRAIIWDVGTTLPSIESDIYQIKVTRVPTEIYLDFWTTFSSGALLPQTPEEIEIGTTDVLDDKAMHIEDEIELSFTTEVFDDGAPP